MYNTHVQVEHVHTYRYPCPRYVYVGIHVRIYKCISTSVYDRVWYYRHVRAYAENTLEQKLSILFKILHSNLVSDYI